MNNGTWFRWVVGGLVAVLLLISGGIIRDVYARIDQEAQVNVTQGTRLAVVESIHEDIKADLREIKAKLDRIERKLR